MTDKDAAVERGSTWNPRAGQSGRSSDLHGGRQRGTARTLAEEKLDNNYRRGSHDERFNCVAAGKLDRRHRRSGALAEVPADRAVIVRFVRRIAGLSIGFPTGNRSVMVMAMRMPVVRVAGNGRNRSTVRIRHVAMLVPQHGQRSIRQLQRNRQEHEKDLETAIHGNQERSVSAERKHGVVATHSQRTARFCQTQWRCVFVNSS